MNEKKINDGLKFLLKGIKSQRKKKSKDIDKIKQLEILLVNIKYANNPNKLQNARKQLNKIYVINKNLHEIKQEKLIDYSGVFEVDGNLSWRSNQRNSY